MCALYGATLMDLLAGTNAGLFVFDDTALARRLELGRRIVMKSMKTRTAVSWWLRRAGCGLKQRK
jgi:hypothetical protein